MELAQRDFDTLDYLIDTISEKGYPPSYRDIQNAVGFKSTSTVQHCLKRLEAEGYIQREDGKSRTIRVDEIFMRTRQKKSAVGRVASGNMLLDAEDYDEFLNLAAASTRCVKKKLFAMKVEGAEMSAEGIMDGDVVVANMTGCIEDGDIVVVMIDGERAVRRYCVNKEGARLQPETRLLAPANFEKPDIIGRVVACMRIF